MTPNVFSKTFFIFSVLFDSKINVSESVKVTCLFSNHSPSGATSGINAPDAYPLLTNFNLMCVSSRGMPISGS